VTYVQPLLFVFLLIGLAGLIRLRKARGSGVIAVSLVGLFLIAWPPVDWLLSRPLEAPYARFVPALEQGQAIVVLSSSVKSAGHGLPFSLPDNDTYERCAIAAWLQTHGHPLPMLVSGGIASGKRPYADVMRQVLINSGVPEAMVWTERESLSTHENAVFSGRILREHQIQRIVLVTEAKDMLRAERCFLKEGFTVIPYAVGISRPSSVVDTILPSWKTIAANERTLHEVAGYFWYRLRGWV
jgi:uncharacterized SAM-binding protein YcdF (DUF218 family)